MKKIAVLAVFIFSSAYVVPLKAEKNEITDARIAAETDAQTDAEHNAKSGQSSKASGIANHTFR